MTQDGGPRPLHAPPPLGTRSTHRAVVLWRFGPEGALAQTGQRFRTQVRGLLPSSAGEPASPFLVEVPLALVFFGQSSG